MGEKPRVQTKRVESTEMLFTVNSLKTQGREAILEDNGFESNDTVQRKKENSTISVSLLDETGHLDPVIRMDDEEEKRGSYCRLYRGQKMESHEKNRLIEDIL